MDIPKELPLPCAQCETELQCPIATLQKPDHGFYYLFYLYKLMRGGYRIENDDLTLKQWTDLGELTECVESHHEQIQLDATGVHMYQAIMGAMAGRMNRGR